VEESHPSVAWMGPSENPAPSKTAIVWGTRLAAYLRRFPFSAHIHIDRDRPPAVLLPQLSSNSNGRFVE